MSYICVWYSRIYRKCLFWFIIKNYVCHFLKVEGKPGQSVTSCAFLWCYLWMWRDPGPSVHSWLALLVGVQRSISDSWDQTVLSPPPVPSTSWITHTDMPGSTGSLGKTSPVFIVTVQLIVQFVSNLGGLVEHRFTGSTRSPQGLT